MVSYKRRRKVNPNDKGARVDFTDEVGDTWEEYHVFHHQFVKWLEVKGYDKQEAYGFSLYHAWLTVQWRADVFAHWGIKREDLGNAQMQMVSRRDQVSRLIEEAMDLAGERPKPSPHVG